MKPLADNRRARHDYQILETYQAGLMLQGWEAKSVRAGRAQIGDGHVVVTRGELFLINCHFTPLQTVSTHVQAEPSRSRKLLLSRNEIRRLIGKIKEAGLTLVPLNLHLSRGKIKADIAVARGKKQYDKRRALEERDWKRQQGRILRGKK